MDSILNKIKGCNSVKEFSEIGPIDSILEAINKEIDPLTLSATTYDELYQMILKLKQRWDTFQNEDYFKSEQLKFIFALTHMKGKARNKLLNLTDGVYKDKGEAQKWYRGIIKMIHPDVNRKYQEQAEEAMKELGIIYGRILKCFEEEDE